MWEIDTDRAPAPKARWAWLALGSNLGDRADTLGEAVRLLEQRKIVVDGLSHAYETAPEGGNEEPAYLNAVARLATGLSPHGLLEVLLEVERHLGRGPVRSGPRTCDLDLLAYGDLVITDPPRLELPHPRMQRRAFVLVPLCELDPHWVHPTLGRTVGELLGALDARAGEVRLFGRLRDPSPGTASGQPLKSIHLAARTPATGLNRGAAATGV